METHGREKSKPSIADATGTASASDSLASPFTVEESFRSQILQNRQNGNDIPEEDWDMYHACLEETLQAPDEVWSRPLYQAENALKLYQFVRCYPLETPVMWYVIVAKETPDREQLEILEAFPTRDQRLIEALRVGEQEIGKDKEQVPGKTLH